VVESEGKVELVFVEVWKEGESAVVPDAGPEVGATEDKEAGVASQGAGEVTAGQGIESELGMLGLELVGGGGEGGVERGEDAEFGRDREVFRCGPQERLVVDDVPRRSHYDTSGRAAFTCSAVTVWRGPADLCSNIQSLPADWTSERRQEYLDYSASAAHLCHGASPALDRLYEERASGVRGAS
jgi:hypothetical protein